MILRPARNKNDGIAALFRDFVTQQGTKSAVQDNTPN